MLDIILSKIMRGLHSFYKSYASFAFLVFFLFYFNQSFSQQPIILNNDLPKSEIRYNSALLSLEINKSVDLKFDGDIKLFFGMPEMFGHLLSCLGWDFMLRKIKFLSWTRKNHIC